MSYVMTKDTKNEVGVVSLQDTEIRTDTDFL